MDEGEVGEEVDVGDVNEAVDYVGVNGSDVAHDGGIDNVNKVSGALGDSGSESYGPDARTRPRRVRRPSTKFQDFQVELPKILVIEAINAVVNPQTVQQALMETDWYQ